MHPNLRIDTFHDSNSNSADIPWYVHLCWFLVFVAIWVKYVSMSRFLFHTKPIHFKFQLNNTRGISFSNCIHWYWMCQKRKGKERKKINTHIQILMHTHTHCDVLSYLAGYFLCTLSLRCVRLVSFLAWNWKFGIKNKYNWKIDSHLIKCYFFRCFFS